MRTPSIIIASLAVALLPFVASAASVTVQALEPGTSVLPGTAVSFNLATADLTSPTFSVSDSLATSSISSSDLNAAGRFSWVPTSSDIGTHTITITAHDSAGDSASVQQTITVVPPPSISIKNLSPGDSIDPGTTLTFNVSAPGFSGPTFIIGDSFSGSSAGDKNISASGDFSWTPAENQDGSHTITVYATDPQGHTAQASVTVQVGPGASVSITSISPSTSISPGQALTFNVTPERFSPTAFSVSDSFAGSSVSNTNINSQGEFSWTPDATDAGSHTLTVRAQVGPYGKAATSSVTIAVLGPGGIIPATTTASSATASASSTPNSTLGALQAQLAALESQISGKIAAGASAAPAFTFTSYLAKGSQGTEVTQLQTVLAQRGFFSQTPTGYFGPVTASAVAAFQKAHGISAVGFVGPATRAALNALVGAASTAATPSASSASSDSNAAARHVIIQQLLTDFSHMTSLLQQLDALN